MRVLLPLAGVLGLMATSAQAELTAQMNAPVTIAPQGVGPQELQRSPAFKNAAPAGSLTQQATPSGSAAAGTETPSSTKHRRRLQDRFEQANTTHDGRLTADQAQASWPYVAKHFADIDADHRGYVTLDQIRAYRREHRHHRTSPASSPAASPASPGQTAPGANTPATQQ